jgi:predicted GNAT superfamily acetyltransferase
MKPIAASTNYIIRPFESIQDHEACQAMQNQVWGEPFAVPVNMTVAVQLHGGVALGAFEARTGQMIGFVLSFVAPVNIPEARNGLSHYSHMAAVAEQWRGRGIGAAMKLAQRDAVLAQGINLITWTYDPLEARNASLNIRKLGCICRLYERNVYGDMADNLNAGIATDRFEVEWWLADPRPQFAPDSPRMEIETPVDFQAIKRRDLNLGKAWRMRTRMQFEQAFKQGYAVTGFDVTGNRACYTLTRLSASLDIMTRL